MGALEGLLVIAIEQAVAAPLCTARLAAAGARVIKIERPGGETARHYDSTVQGTSAYFAWLNGGKESAVLNLKTDSDLALLMRMLARADVLVQNLAPGALDRLGLGKDVLMRDFPNLIAVNIVGYGQDTAYADMRAYDLLVQAESGLCSVTGTPDVASKVGVSAADIATGTNAHAAVLEALIARATTGRGKHIEMSMFDSIADWMTVPLLHFEHAGIETARYGLSHASIYPYRPFACADGTIVIAVQNDAEWSKFCVGVVQRPDLGAMPQFANNPLRVRNRNELDAIADPIFAAMTLAIAKARCSTAGIAWSQYNSVKGLAEHCALGRGDVTLADGTCVALPRPAGRSRDFKAGKLPALGEHTAALRQEFGSA